MSPPTFRPTPPAQARWDTETTAWTLIFRRDLRHPPERVWAALTEADQLAAWAPFIPDRDLGTTGAATLTLVDGDTREDHPGTVRRVEPPRLLEYTWGEDLLRWELVPHGDGTRLTLRHTVDDEGLGPMVAAGWHLCLDVAERLLDGDPVAPIRGSDAKDFGWEELREAYAEHLGR